MPDLGERFGSSAIRVDGAFNPAIVNPDWLLAKDLIDEVDRAWATEVDHDRVLLTHLFSGGRYPWIVVEVTRDLLNVSSTDETETPERLREFVVKLLTSLPETPVHGVGVSHVWHMILDRSRWERIAEMLAPTAPWESFAGSTRLDRLERRIELEGGERTITVAPSMRAEYDLYFEVWSYWELGTPPGVDPAVAVERLDDDWEETVKSAERLLESTLAIA